MAQNEDHTVHLKASELGTKEYWDEYYQNELDHENEDDGENEQDHEKAHNSEPPELESWFDDVGAPTKTLAFLRSEKFPLSPNFTGPKTIPSVLDLGTGNGSALFSLRIEGGYQGPMVGVDYSDQSIRLAKTLLKRYHSTLSKVRSSGENVSSADMLEKSSNISFEVADIIRDDLTKADWWPRNSKGFDLILDKGTFDAISLSEETVMDTRDGREKRICEIYPGKVVEMLAPGGFLLITTCNWTEDEIVHWFTVIDESRSLNVFDSIKYPVFRFGGQSGQGVASVCFRKDTNL